jgi:hypothetical protein
MIERAGLSHLKLGIFVASQRDGSLALYLLRRNEPEAAVPDEYEQEVNSPPVECLDHSRPALIAARGCQLDLIVIRSSVGSPRRLHLNAKQPSGEVGDHVVVGTVE